MSAVVLQPMPAWDLSNMAAFVIVFWLLTFFVLHWLYQGIRNNLSHIPGPKLSRWSSLVNTYHWLKGQWPKYVHSLHQEYGPIVRVSPDQVCVADLDSFKKIHRPGSRHLKSQFYRHLVPANTYTVFSFIDPQDHANRRRLLAAPMSDSSLAHMEPIIAAKVRLAVARAGEEMQERGVADVFTWWLFMATDVIGELTFGKSFEMLELKKKNQYIIDLEHVSSGTNIRTAFPTLIKIAAIIPLPYFKSFVEAGKRLTVYGRQSLDRYEALVAENPSNPTPTLFTKLFSDDKCGLTSDEVQHDARSYIIAGSDTTAYTQTCLVYAVCKNPQVRDTLVAELATLPGGFTETDTRALSYLGQVINETLRLYPVVCSLPRSVPPEGSDFAGYRVPGGVTVSSQIYSLNRDEAIFPDPDTFDPARWANATKAMKDALMTFGGGSRTCLGMHLARIELRLATAHFFRAFPRARVSAKEGMSDDDMELTTGFLATVKGHRCLIES